MGAVPLFPAPFPAAAVEEHEVLEEMEEEVKMEQEVKVCKIQHQVFLRFMLAAEVVVEAVQLEERRLLEEEHLEQLEQQFLQQ